MPVIIAGNKAQKDKYLTRMIEEPLMCVSKAGRQLRKIADSCTTIQHQILSACIKFTGIQFIRLPVSLV